MLAYDEFSRNLDGAGVGVQVGPFGIRFRTSLPQLHEPLHSFYSTYPGLPEAGPFSVCADLQPVRRLTRPFSRQVRFSVDGLRPHEDMPTEHALPVLEWGINLAIAFRGHAFLMLHCGVVERNGQGLVMPGAPGSGKSTLTAALSTRGFRTLSDEFGLFRPGDTAAQPVPRPIALKNESISIIREFAPDALMGPTSRGTRKGDVAHVKPSDDSIGRQHVPAPVTGIMFPQWKPGARFSLEPLAKADAFMLLATNAFNYDLLGEVGFRTINNLVNTATCYRLSYSDLDEACSELTAWTDEFGA